MAAIHEATASELLWISNSHSLSRSTPWMETAGRTVPSYHKVASRQPGLLAVPGSGFNVDFLLFCPQAWRGACWGPAVLLGFCFLPLRVSSARLEGQSGVPSEWGLQDPSPARCECWGCRKWRERRPSLKIFSETTFFR